MLLCKTTPLQCLDIKSMHLILSVTSTKCAWAVFEEGEIRREVVGLDYWVEEVPDRDTHRVQTHEDGLLQMTQTEENEKEKCVVLRLRRT
eukprot:g40075.t1